MREEKKFFFLQQEEETFSVANFVPSFLLVYTKFRLNFQCSTNKTIFKLVAYF